MLTNSDTNRLSLTSLDHSADLGAPQSDPKSVRLLLTPCEAAHALAVSQRTLWSFTHRGKLRCVRLGRSVRYSLDDLRTFVEAQR